MGILLRKMGMLFALALGACGGGGYACPAIAAADFTIVITDSMSGQRICNAMVVVTDTATGEMATITPFGGSTDCSYSGGFYERPGTFSVTATLSGYKPTTKDGITVTKGECNVNTAQVTLQLGP